MKYQSGFDRNRFWHVIAILIKRTEFYRKIVRITTPQNDHHQGKYPNFIKAKYTDESLHVKIHNKFRKKVNKFIKQVRDKNIDTKKIIKEAADFSGSWLLNHILIMDKKYSKQFNEHKIK